MDLLRALDKAARHALPATLILVAVVLLAIPGLLPDEAELRAGFVIISVYFWTLYRPSALPAPVLALLGILLDLLGDTPLGLWAVLLLLGQASIMPVRRALVRQGFMLVWLTFAGFAAALCAVEWLGRAMLDLTLLPLAPIMIQGIMAILLYPLLAVPLIRAHRGAAAPEQA